MKNKLIDLIKDYEAREIFNALPNKTMYFKGQACNNAKVEKERLSILLCTNMDGSEKIKPMVVYKSETPRCLKNINKSKVNYRWNKNAWMTQILLNDFNDGEILQEQL